MSFRPEQKWILLLDITSCVSVKILPSGVCVRVDVCVVVYVCVCVCVRERVFAWMDAGVRAS